VGVAILGMLVLVSDQDTDVLFEPWGVAAAVLVTSLIVRSEVRSHHTGPHTTASAW
jgi:hypothetical protein